MLNVSQHLLWLGYTTHTKLLATLRMLSIKIDYNTRHGYFDETMVLLKETNLEGNLVPPNIYKSKKLVSKLSPKQKMINCCINGCMLYYKSDKAKKSCKNL